MVSPEWYLVVAGILFFIGLFGVLIRKDLIVILMCVELMLNAANITFVAAGKGLNDIGGVSSAMFTLVVASAEVSVGLALVVAMVKTFKTIDLNVTEGEASNDR
jgi:NADH-quinone oxidoreductase subunit K